MSARFFADTATLTARALKHITRSPDTIITTAVMPIAMMLVFVYVFGGAITTGGAYGGYIDYMLPGILLITVAMGISYTAFRIYADLNSGIFDRFHSMPVSRSAALWAHVLTSLVANVVSLMLVIAAALVIGFRSGAGLAEWGVVAVVLLLFTVALTWVAVIAGLSATSSEGATVFSYPLVFLPFISSAFVPTGSMPGPVRWFAEHQPATSIADALRSFLDGRPVGADIWAALAWCVGVGVVAYLVAMLVYRRRTA